MPHVQFSMGSLKTERQDSVAGSVNQATGLPDFEDGSRTGTKLEVRNGLQSVRTIPEVNMVSPLGPAMTPGAVWGHDSRIRVEADQSPTCRVPRFSGIKLQLLWC